MENSQDSPLVPLGLFAIDPYDAVTLRAWITDTGDVDELDALYEDVQDCELELAYTRYRIEERMKELAADRLAKTRYIWKPWTQGGRAVSLVAPDSPQRSDQGKRSPSSESPL